MRICDVPRKEHPLRQVGRSPRDRRHGRGRACRAPRGRRSRRFTRWSDPPREGPRLSRPNWERRRLGGATGPPGILPVIGVAGVSPAIGTTGVPPAVKATPKNACDYGAEQSHPSGRSRATSLIRICYVPRKEHRFAATGGAALITPLGEAALSPLHSVGRSTTGGATLVAA